MDDFGLLVGRYLATLPTLTDLEPRELTLDQKGRLIIAGRFLEDSAHTSGDPGIFTLAVRKDTEGSLVDADGDYAPLQVDSSGRLRVVADLDVTNLAEKAEDSAHSSGDIGNYVLAVRADTRPTNANTSADGDYASIFVNANGEIYVHDTDALAKLTEIDTVLDTIKVDTGSISTNISDLTKAEDAPHSSGDKGIMALTVRNDTDAALTSADGDYSPIAVDSAGKVKVKAETDPPGSEAYNATDDLAPAADGLITGIGGTFTEICAVAVGVGETAYIYGWQADADKNAVFRLVTDDGTNVAIHKVRLNSSAMPGIDEHWSESGRIEVAGSATMNVKIFAKRRGVTGNMAASGSLHIRKV